jgi:hypothetical protein
MATFDSHWFGRRPHEDLETKRAWGARAIYRFAWNQIVGDYAPEVQTLGDRQSYEGFDADPAADRAFVDWLNARALPEIKKRLVREFVTADGAEVVAWDDGPRHIEASPQGSHGYLYIGAWEA